MKYLYKKTIATGICLGLLTVMPSLAAATKGQGSANDSQVYGGATTVVQGDDIIASSTGASIEGGSHNVAVGYSTQIINGSGVEAYNYGALVIGGEGNTAIGTNAQVLNGSDLKAIGYGAVAGHGNSNTAIGNYAYAGGLSQGQLSNGNVAIGQYAEAYGGNSVAIGANSIANEANTVSIGQPGYERRIMNLAPGTYGTDAVNMSQLWNVENKVNRVGAIAMAVSALAPMPYDPKDPTQFSAGMGTFDGQNAVALGVYHYTKPSVLINAAFAMSDDKWEKAARIGITWKTGGPKPKSLMPATAKEQKPVENNTNILDRIQKLITDSNP